MARQVFETFENADGTVFDQLIECVKALEREATFMTKEYLKNGPEPVKLRVRAVADEVLDLRHAIGESLVLVVREQWSFRDITGAFQPA